MTADEFVDCRKPLAMAAQGCSQTTMVASPFDRMSAMILKL